MRNIYQSAKEKLNNKNAQVAAAAMTALTMSAQAHAAGTDAFFAPFCGALNFFSGKSPLVAFVVMAGGFGILVTLLLGEDRGMLSSVIKWLAGGAGLVGISSLVSSFFGITVC